MNLRRFCLSLILVLCFMTLTIQAQTDIVSLQVEAGFDNYYHVGKWFPVQVDVANQGDDINAVLTVRPETSDRTVSNAYSAPVDLPSGSAKTVFLYIQARQFPSSITVELLTDDGVRVTQERVIMTPLDARDEVHIAITGSNAAALNLSGLHTAGFAAQQADWSVSNLPDKAQALEAVETIWLNGIDSEALTGTQIAAIEEWVLSGGHLVVFGGPAWEQTASRLVDLLPISPDSTTTVDDLSALAVFAGDRRAELTGDTVVTTGTLHDAAQVVVATDEGLPLLMRREPGGGTVDYIAADPGLAPLRNWNNLNDLWLQVIASSDPQPAWMAGITENQQAAAALATLPGVELLPPVTSMLLFLGAYILLIGPVNYLILSRLNRRGFAWITIPLLIIVFSGLAWTVGFNLRGNDVILHRLNIVQTWDDSETAHLEQLISVLAPRRDSFDMTIADDRFLRVMPGLQANSLLAGALEQSTVDIVQTDDFRADGFTVDGGIFSNFNASGFIAKPDISGSLTLVYNNGESTQALQGIIRNDSDFTLEDPVLLARNLALPLENLSAGDSVTINTSDTIMESAEAAIPAPAALSQGYSRILSLRETNFFRSANTRTIADILGEIDDEPLPGSLEADTRERRRALLASFARDQFSSTARGNDVYLAGWSNSWPDDDINLVDTGTQTLQTTLYLIKLDVTVDRPDETITIQPDQFTLFWLEADNTLGTLPDDLTLNTQSSVTMRLTPVMGSVLDNVTGMQILLDRASSYGRQYVLSLWNHNTGRWDDIDDTRREEYIITTPGVYLGANNSVDMRFTMDIPFGSAWVRHIGIRQTGTFEADE